MLALGAYEAALQYGETAYVRRVAREAVRGLPQGDERSAVTALRDYVRAHVRHEARHVVRERPVLRASAADTLRAGKGDCGEATRVFINLAGAVGIRAQRLYLEGPQPHVVAEVSLRGGDEVVVDAYDAPFIPELETFDEVMRRPEFTHYSSLNWRRALSSLPSFRVSLGPLSYLLENPRALKASLWFALGSALLSARLMRLRGRRGLIRRAWARGRSARAVES
jgi:Transglutaminase-like superfamily